jgi:hypothetical protein
VIRIGRLAHFPGNHNVSAIVAIPTLSQRLPTSSTSETVQFTYQRYVLSERDNRLNTEELLHWESAIHSESVFAARVGTSFDTADSSGNSSRFTRVPWAAAASHSRLFMV